MSVPALTVVFLLPMLKLASVIPTNNNQPRHAKYVISNSHLQRTAAI